MKTLQLSLSTIFFVLLGSLLPSSALSQTTDQLQFFKPYDQRGVNIFETPKDDTVTFEGLDLRWGAAFTQQFQALEHRTASPDHTLTEIGPGFNLATANLNLDAQIADGIRVNLITYLSSRHHPEAWVKGGFVQVDRVPFLEIEPLDNLMEYLTLRVGHFEINYGDGHFRRTDNGNAMYNPFVGNYVMDAFTTEIGAEVLFQTNGLLAMGAVTGGEINGSVQRPEDRAPAFIGKLGYDSQVSPDLRMRLTGSVYHTEGSANNTLYGGDRAGSRFYDVLDGGDFSGRLNPGFGDQVTAFQINPFVKYRGLELFGLVEQAEGQAHDENDTRAWNQYSAEALYRFGPREQLYLGGRYNVASGELAGGTDVSVDRIQIGAGWFATRNVLAKIGYVSQNYRDYPGDSVFHEGRFNGFMIEGVIAF